MNNVEQIHELKHIHKVLRTILEEIRIMATSIVTRAQFDAALASAVTTISTAISDLQAKIAAGSVVTPEDFSSELATLQGLVGTATAADPGPQSAPVSQADGQA